MFKNLTKTVAFAIVLSFSSLSNAAIITGEVPSVYGNPTFGGSGIPNDQITYMDFGNYLLGIAITPRFSSAPVTNVGSSYFAETGVSTTPPDRSTWNFSFFAAINPLAQFTSFADAGLTSLSLMYDMDSGAGTDFGVWDFSALLGLSILPVIEGSQNSTFGFLSVDDANLGGSGTSITAPTGGSVFSPFASGNYEFKWVANGNDAVSVDVTVSVPEPSTIAIMLMSILGLIGARKLRK